MLLFVKSSSQVYLHYTTIMLSFALLLGLRSNYILLRVCPHLISASSTSTHVQSTAFLGMHSPRLSRDYVTVLSVPNQGPDNIESMTL